MLRLYPFQPSFILIMEPFVSNLIAGVTSSTVVGLIIGVLLLRRTETVKKEVEGQFSRLTDAIRSRRSWKERSVAELLGPMVIQLDRTKQAFSRYKARNLYLEAQVLREGNLTIRDLLLKHPHLIPPELFAAAIELIEHYDCWLEEYDRVRAGENPDLETAFVFVGPQGYPFPHKAEAGFRKIYHQFWTELYGEEQKATMK